jgi:hypothetical protein
MSSYIPRILGVGTAAILAIDAVKAGLNKGRKRTNAYLADELTDVYIRQQSSPTDSPLYDKVKQWVVGSALDAKYMPILHGIYNTVASTAGQLLKYSVPLGLAAGAIILPYISLSLGWACVAGLAGGAALTVINMGFGLFPNTNK